MARRKRKKAPQQPKVTGPNYTGPLIIAVVILVAIIGIMHFANADRSWQEYIGAGDRALERGNYDWAEKMYREALQYAEGKGAKTHWWQKPGSISNALKKPGRKKRDASIPRPTLPRPQAHL